MSYVEVLKCFLGFFAFKDRISGLCFGISTFTDTQPANKPSGVCAPVTNELAISRVSPGQVVA